MSIVLPLMRPVIVLSLFFENLLAFVNPDESVVVLMQNDLCEELPVRIKVGEKVIGATLEADSYNTFVVQT